MEEWGKLAQQLMNIDATSDKTVECMTVYLRTQTGGEVYITPYDADDPMSMRISIRSTSQFKDPVDVIGLIGYWSQLLTEDSYPVGVRWVDRYDDIEIYLCYADR